MRRSPIIIHLRVIFKSMFEKKSPEAGGCATGDGADKGDRGHLGERTDRGDRRDTGQR